MFGLGMGELLVILAVALLVLGPKRLPEMASGLGKAIRDFRRATQDIQSQLEVDETVAKPLAELKSALRDQPLPPARPAVVPKPPEGEVVARGASAAAATPAVDAAVAAPAVPGTGEAGVAASPAVAHEPPKV